jgi:hypothetical protein
MIRLDLRHDLACDAETYWSCILDDLYAHALFVETLKFKRYDATNRDLVRHVTRLVHAEPPPDGVPAILRSKLAYVEEGDLDRTRSLYTFFTVNRQVPGMRVRGCMHVQQLGQKRCRRTAEIHVEVKLLGLGGFVEDRLAKDLRRSYDVSAEFTDRWVG